MFLLNFQSHAKLTYIGRGLISGFEQTYRISDARGDNVAVGFPSTGLYR